MEKITSILQSFTDVLQVVSLVKFRFIGLKLPKEQIWQWKGAQLCSTTANNVPLLERFPWKLQRTLLISGCKHCKDFGKCPSLTAEAVGCTPHTAFPSAWRCLVSEMLKTLMAGYTRLLNDFPPSSQLSQFFIQGIKLPWPKAGLLELCSVQGTALLPHHVPGNQRHKCTLHGMAYISAINSYFQHNPSSGSYSKT